MELYIEPSANLTGLLKRCVEVKCINNSSVYGWIHSVDPLSRSLILVKFSDEEKVSVSEVIFVPGYNIKRLEILDRKLSDQMDSLLDNILKKKEVVFSQKEVENRREALCVWLSGNRVPFTVTEEMGIEVLQAAVILPPYTPESIRCKNEVVLDKVMKLVTTAPGLQPSTT